MDVDEKLFERIDEENIQRRNQRKQEGVNRMTDDILARANRNLAVAYHFMTQVQQFKNDILQLFSQQDGLDEIRRLISQAFRTARNPNGFLVGKRKVYQQADGTPKKASILK